MRRLATTALVCAWVLGVSGCGSAASARTSSPQSSPAATGAAVPPGPCAAVRTTTPIEQVSLACQTLWLSGGSVAQPDCNLYPISSKLFAVGAVGREYFARKRLPTDWFGDARGNGQDPVGPPPAWCGR